MKFKEILLQGTLIKRYKRFFVDVQYKEKIITAHCPNTGSMMGLLETGNKVFFSKVNNPKRKLKYTLQIIEDKKKLVGVNTHLTNKIVLEGFNNKKIKELVKFDTIKSEVFYSKHTRFDFLITKNKKKCFLEVKNVTLSRQRGIAEFPDSITSRGSKHLEELISAKKKGYDSCILYLIQRNDCKKFKIASNIDEKYNLLFQKAIKSKIKILCYDCKITNKEIKLNNQIIYES
jgi:sugar fermentation stimulation protein A